MRQIFGELYVEVARNRIVGHSVNPGWAARARTDEGAGGGRPALVVGRLGKPGLARTFPARTKPQALHQQKPKGR